MGRPPAPRSGSIAAPSLTGFAALGAPQSVIVIPVFSSRALPISPSFVTIFCHLILYSSQAFTGQHRKTWWDTLSADYTLFLAYSPVALPVKQVASKVEPDYPF